MPTRIGFSETTPRPILAGLLSHRLRNAGGTEPEIAELVAKINNPAITRTVIADDFLAKQAAAVARGAT